MTEKIKRLISEYYSIILFLVGGTIFIYGWWMTDYKVLSMAIFLIWINNFFFSIKKMKERIVFFLFQCTFFTFLISRPIIETITTKEWWIATDQADAQLKFAFFSIALSLVGLFLGGIVISKFNVFFSRRAGRNWDRTDRFTVALQNVSLAIF